MKSEGNAKTINMQAYMHRDRITWLRRQKVKMLIETNKQKSKVLTETPTGKSQQTLKQTNKQKAKNIKAPTSAI